MPDGCTCRSNPPPCDATSRTLWCGCVFNGQTLYPSCNGAGTFINVVFGSMGTPSGDCGNYEHGACSAPPATVIAAIEQRCLGQPECEVFASVAELADGVDPCFGTQKFTAVTLECSAEIPTNFERFRSEWGLLTLMVLMFAGFVVYAVGGAMLYPRADGRPVNSFGHLGNHPHAHNWLELVQLVQDGFTYAFGGSSLPAPSAAVGSDRDREQLERNRATPKRHRGEKSSSKEKKKKKKEKKETGKQKKSKEGSRKEPLLLEHRQGDGSVHPSQQKIKVVSTTI